MITVAQSVYELLVSTGANVWYYYPQSWVSLPAISWRESGNREFAQADGQEHLAELEYTVDIWSVSPEENAELAALIDARMATLRMRRDYAADLFETSTGFHHRCVRYRCVADASGNIYQ